jgi:redox-sensitive bicupin YhaK (pirin superfamily)
MSTGKGVFHSEYNNNPDQPAKFLQIWVFPNRLNVTPRYDQIPRDPVREHNRLQQLISPSQQGEGTWIYQDAWFHIGHFDKDKTFSYDRKEKGNGVYLFVISGSFLVDGTQPIDARDGLGITGEATIGLTATTDGSELLVIEVPMNLKIQ